jgi:hypothetical protein
MTQAQLTQSVTTPLGHWIAGQWVTLLGQQITLCPPGIIAPPAGLTVTLPIHHVLRVADPAYVAPDRHLRVSSITIADLYVHATPEAQARADQHLGNNLIDRAIRRYDRTLEVA